MSMVIAFPFRLEYAFEWPVGLLSPRAYIAQISARNNVVRRTAGMTSVEPFHSDACMSPAIPARAVTPGQCREYRNRPQFLDALSIAVSNSFSMASPSLP